MKLTRLVNHLIVKVLENSFSYIIYFDAVQDLKVYYIPLRVYSVRKFMMLYNQDAVVSSSQDCLVENIVCTGPTEPIGVMTGRRHLNPQLKMPKVAKVSPFRKEDDKIGNYKIPKEKIKPTKKQLFPWMHKFNNICRESLGCKDYIRLDNLMRVFIRYVVDDVNDCYKKPNRASKLKNRMGSYLRYFHSLYKNTKKPLENDNYKDRMSYLLAMYLDMEIRASRRGRELPKVISERLTSSLFVLLDDSKEHILNSILSAKFIRKCFNDICIPVIRSVVRDIPKQLDKKKYFQYIFLCKKWKLLVVKKEDLSEIKKVTSKLVPPFEVILESEKLYGLSCSSGKTSQENICMRYMRDPKFKFKLRTKNCVNSKSRKSIDDIENGSPLFSEDIYYNNKIDPMMERKFALYLRHIWNEWNDLSASNVEYDPTIPLYEESDQSVGETQIFDRTIIRNNDINEKDCVKWRQSLPTRNVGSSINLFPRCMAYSSKDDLVKFESNHYTDSGHVSEINFIDKIKSCSTPKMEADSQSQDEVIVITDDDDDDEYEVSNSVKEELKEKVVIDANLKDMVQFPIHRVRPGGRTENIDDTSVNENDCVESVQLNSSANELITISSECIQPSCLDHSSPQNGSECRESDKEKECAIVPPEGVKDVEEHYSSQLEADQPSPLSHSKTNNDLLLEDISKEDSGQEGPSKLWSDEQLFEDIFDSSDLTKGLVFSSDGTGNSRTHDVFLGQHDDLLYQYECGINMNKYPEFYNDQPDIMFSGVDFLEDPMLCNTLEDLIEDVSYNDKNKTSPERELLSQNSVEESGAFESSERKRGRRRRSVTKIQSISPLKTIETSEQCSLLPSEEDVCSNIEEVSQTLKRRKSARFMTEEEKEVEGKETIEQNTKKRKTQPKKGGDKQMPASAKSSPQNNGKKRKKAQMPSTKKKSQRRRR